jgi:hypothetical protein
MHMQRPNNKFDAEDRKVYTAWLRKTLIVYGVLILIGTVMLAAQAAKPTASAAGSRPTPSPSYRSHRSRSDVGRSTMRLSLQNRHHIHFEIELTRQFSGSFARGLRPIAEEVRNAQYQWKEPSGFPMVAFMHSGGSDTGHLALFRAGGTE